MSLTKIPLIIGVCFSFKLCMISPNPPPLKEERLEKGNPPLWVTHEVLQYATRLQFLAGLLEILSILSYHHPASPLSRSFLSLFILRGGNTADLRPSLLTTIGGTMLITGALIRLVTYRYLGKFFRFQASIQHDHQLITGGPYSIVRHPGYSAALLTQPGWFLWQFGSGSWLRESGLWNTVAVKIVVGSFAGFVMFGCLCLVVFVRMGAEDKALRQRFGSEWDEYASRVKYSLVPFIH